MKFKFSQQLHHDEKNDLALLLFHVFELDFKYIIFNKNNAFPLNVHPAHLTPCPPCALHKVGIGTGLPQGFMDGKKACEKMIDALELEPGLFRSVPWINYFYRIAYMG